MLNQSKTINVPKIQTDTKKTISNNNSNIELTADRLMEIGFYLSRISPDLPYLEWLAIGMALHNIGCSCDIWDNWSKNGEKYEDGICESKWDSFTFTESGYGFGTLYHYGETLYQQNHVEELQAIENKNREYYLNSFDYLMDETCIPCREFIFGDILIPGKLSVFIAPPGVGKSTFAMEMAYSIVSGDRYLGIKVHHQCNVAIINNEDDQDELNRRMLAIQKQFNIDVNKLKYNIHIQSGENLPFTLAFKDADKKMKPYHQDAIIEYIKEHDIRVLIVDPFLETHEGDENDNRDISNVAKMYREIAQRANCAVLIIHHSRKEQAGSSDGHVGNMDSGRGASSLSGVARVVYTLYGMSDSHAKEWGVRPNQKHLYIRLDSAKANLSLSTDEPMWFRRDSVHLDNGDIVGVLVPATELDNKRLQTSKINNDDFLNQIIIKDNFFDLKAEGCISRERFINMLFDAKIYLGNRTEARGTMHDRSTKLLLDNKVENETCVIWMDKQSGRYFVHFEDK
jgi:KaiC/GvpD/RAD55 family RecA-like ATPase